MTEGDSLMAPMLTTLSPEILHEICLNVDPPDLARLSRTCHFLDGFIRRDDLLWKLQYLDRFDEPSSSQELDAQSWRSVLQNIVSVGKILESEDQDMKKESTILERVYQVVYDIMMDSTSDPVKNMLFLSEHLATESNISAFLCRSSLFRHARFPSDQPACSETLRQLSAKLHVYYGLEVEPSSEALCDSVRQHSSSNPLFVRQVHPYARSRIYDLRRYRNSNLWGPFMDDGSLRVDWEKIQCIMVDLCYNLRMYTERRHPASSLGTHSLAAGTSSGTASNASSASTSPSTASASTSSTTSSTTSSSHLWDQPFQGLAPNSYTSYHLTGKLAPSLHPSLDALDPYGVSGTWMRIVCFLDYNDLYAFNFENGWIPLTQEREPIETREAFRLIRLQLHVVSVEMPEPEATYWEFEAASGSREGKERLREAEGGEGEWKRMPIVRFEGRSKSTYMAWDPNANSKIRGTVRMTPHGAIHWTTFSIFHGEERWRSEGIQIGGIRSARGILGNWFDKDYDVHGPAGPTAFWKVSDDIVEEKKQVNNTFWGFLSQQASMNVDGGAEAEGDGDGDGEEGGTGSTGGDNGVGVLGGLLNG